METGTQDVFDPKDVSVALSVRAMADRFCIVDLVKCADDALASFLSEAMHMPGDEYLHSCLFEMNHSQVCIWGVGSCPGFGLLCM